MSLNSRLQNNFKLGVGGRTLLTTVTADDLTIAPKDYCSYLKG